MSTNEVELVVGDIRDRAAFDRSLEGIDDVVHLAARIGVVQSLYEIAEYTSVNVQGSGETRRGRVGCEHRERPQRVGVRAGRAARARHGEGTNREHDATVGSQAPCLATNARARHR